MWRQLERSVTSATAVAPAHERFWAAVARRPAALAFFTRFHQHQVCVGGGLGRWCPPRPAIPLWIKGSQGRGGS